MSSRTRKLVFSLAVLLLPGTVHAGMSSFTLTEAASARIDVVSFFLFVFAMSSLALRWAWNVLARDFAWMPRIGFKQALAMMLVSGLFLYVILTMISGARELMTPGAWAKTGLTYELVSPDRDPKSWLESGRRHALENLRDALWQYAQKHEGNLPGNRENPEISAEMWAGVHPQREPLGYMPGRRPGLGTQLIVFEPDAYGPKRFCLQADGAVIKLTAEELARRVLAESVPEVKP